jgi:glycosyltransferase involved in cell wall biosynthesis
MTSEPPITIDIVVNNHNYGAYVCDAVDSARAQDHPAVNVVVVDDGSTDDSRERLRRYDGAVDLVLRENGGQPAALNTGFSRCRGDAVLFLDADDVLEPTAASRAAAALAAEPAAARVQFRMAVIDAEGHRLGLVRPPGHLPLPSGDLRRAELAFPFDMAWVGTSGNVYRSELLRRIMPIPAEDYGLWGADWYLVHLTTLLGPVVAIDEIGGLYRLHGRNAFEPAAPVLDLDRIRREIRYQQTTAALLLRLADELGLERPQEILSLSNLALRVISHRLDAAGHPVVRDRAVALVWKAVQAATRRHDVSIALRAAMVVWLAAITASPRPLAQPLAELFVFPERRQNLTSLTRRMHRQGPRDRS